MMKRAIHRTTVWTVCCIAGCASESSRVADLSAARAELERVLAEERAAHLQVDADLLARSVGDSLLSVDAGRVTTSSRDEVAETFATYFSGASYDAWDDVVPPRIGLSADGAMAWVVRQVRVARREPDGAGGIRTRTFTSAYTATYERRAEDWVMTTVTSTLLPDEGEG